MNNEIWVSLIPVLSSVAGIIVTVLTFISKVKGIIGDNKTTNKVLKKSLKESGEKQEAILTEIKSDITVIQLSLKEAQEMNKQLVEENKKLKESLEKVTDLVDNEKTIKTQLTALLNKEE